MSLATCPEAGILEADGFRDAKTSRSPSRCDFFGGCLWDGLLRLRNNQVLENVGGKSWARILESSVGLRSWQLPFQAIISLPELTSSSIDPLANLNKPVAIVS